MDTKINRIVYLSLPVAISLNAFTANGQGNKQKPNILWITTEDISPNLGCYGDAYAHTPVLDSLAKNGIKFSNAFSTSTVSTPSRSCIITGVYACSMGTQHLRGDVKLSDNIRCFTEYLRNNGYYCSNNQKEDYNFKTPASAWDESSNSAHWRKRKDGQPFFSVFNLGTTHQGAIRYDEKELLARNEKLPAKARHKWEDAPVPPYYPDTRAAKVNMAALYTQITLMDYEVGNLLAQLKEDGLDDETIVFFFSDHGTGLPRHKRWIYDTGTKVPFIVYLPQKYRHLSFVKSGSTYSNFICFEDLAPTVLDILGMSIPDYMKGKTFLGNSIKKRECIYTTNDRVDENYFFSRSVREEKLHYIRNFFPFLPRMPYSHYSDVTPIRKELRRLHQEGNLHGDAAWLMEDRTPIEELYDIEKDPLELNNLAGNPLYANEVARMHKNLKAWMISQRDISLIPEPEIRVMAGQLSPYDYFQNKGDQFFETVFNKADRVGRGYSELDFLKDINDKSAVTRYWSVIGLRNLQSQGTKLTISPLLKLLKDDSEIVRIMAAEIVLRQEDNQMAKSILFDCLNGPDDSGKYHALISLFALHKDKKIDLRGQEKQIQESVKGDGDIFTRQGRVMIEFYLKML